MSADLLVLRQQVRPLLDLAAPRDGLAAYYALYHDPSRTRLVIAQDDVAPPNGFLALCQTGRDLFQQVAVLRAHNHDSAAALLQRGLLPRRPYYLLTTPDLAPAVEEKLVVEKSTTHCIYHLDLSRYAPTINVLVVPAPSADGSPRFVIRSQAVSYTHLTLPTIYSV